MKWNDLLKMSSQSLARRKLQSFLTILGVIIGSSAIMCMVSIALGLTNQLNQNIDKFGGPKQIQVSAKTKGKEEGQKKYITDRTIKEIRALEHVEAVFPVLEVQAVLLTPKYHADVILQGLSPEAMKMLKLELQPGGSLPKPNELRLSTVLGSDVMMAMREKGSDKNTVGSTLGDMNFADGQMEIVLDSDSYYAYENRNRGTDLESSKEETEENSVKQVQRPKKSQLMISGMTVPDESMEGMGMPTIYCDVQTLRNVLKKEFAGKGIPGQPRTKTGQPYKDFVYSSASVRIDDVDHAEIVDQQIKKLQYETMNIKEQIKEVKKMALMYQIVFGGIGMISLIVAAIGIANTMMMSVYERTKEIGVFKVLGCSLANIRQLFLLEAAFIGLVGGILGSIISMGVSAC